jgi:hypothetical protein
LGETVARPLFHEYPKDNNTHGIDQQFLWGRSLLISPFIFQVIHLFSKIRIFFSNYILSYFHKNQTEVNVYVPNDVWYEPTKDFAKIYPKVGHLKIPEPKVAPVLHMRGGSIIPIANDSAVNTKLIREMPLNLEVFPKDRTAFGDLFWDDGESIDTIEKGNYNYYEFRLFKNCSLEIKVIKHGFDSGSHQSINKIFIANTIFGEIVAHIDGIAIGSPVTEEDYTLLMININLSSKKSGDKWVIDWKLKSNNECNLK